MKESSHNTELNMRFPWVLLQESKTLLFLLFFVMLLFESCQTNKTLKDPLEAGWKGKDVCEILSETEKLRTLKCTFPPNIGHERHYHAEHFGYTIKGSKFRITDTTGTREVNVPTGYDFYNKRIEWHEVLNIGKDTAIFLIVEPK